MRATGLNTRIRVLPWLLCAIAPPALAQGLPPLQVAPELLQGATEVRAERIYGTREMEIVAEGQAELLREDLHLSADRIGYRELLDEVHAEGNVVIHRSGERVSGPSARFIVHARSGEIEQPEYEIGGLAGDGAGDEAGGATLSGRGQAEVMYFEGENQYRLKGATWTTCEAPDPDWYIKADTLRLDYDRERGEVHGSSLVFKNTPILWWPWAEFPLSERRQSGLLVPTVGMSNKTGLDISLPYYWNIAPNYDATLAPRIMSRRGLQLGGEFRYLTGQYRGETRVELMPRDQVTGESRSLGAWQHQQRITPHLFASLDINAVSDDRYFEDLSSRVEGASTSNLLREGRLWYTGGGWWTASALVQSYQNLTQVDAPYRRVPQLRLDGRRGGLPGGAVFTIESEFVEFDHEDARLATGQRLFLHPQLALPVERPGYFITPRASFHFTRYRLDEPTAAGRSDITRAVPVLSVDSGLFFDRDTRVFGNAMRQTLEPRLMYLRVPYRRQNDIPVFDTDRYDFGFAQIFSENRYSGIDRLADANQITAAVTTRLIEPDSGLERFRATVGQRYYFSDRKVLLPDERDIGANRTDLLAAVSGRLTRTLSTDALLQYNADDGSTERFNVSLRYQPDYAKVLNVGYRFSRDVLRDLDISAQWPLGGRWYGVARVSRSILEKRITEAIGGVEYDGGCWVFRTALHRFATNPDDVTNALFFQLELGGLGGIGPSPVNLLRRSVPGYGKINDSLSNRYFGNE